MKKGYVGFTNEKYKALTDVMVDSLLTFSKYPITIYSINFDYTHTSDRVNVVRINIQNESFARICYVKIFATYNNDYDVGMILDSDMVINKDIDEMLDIHGERALTVEYPLCLRQPQNPSSNLGTPTANYINSFFQKFGVEYIEGYVHASFVFSKKSKFFLQAVFDTCCDLEKQGIIPPTHDESVLNLMLYNNGWINDIGFDYAPYYGDGFFDSYCNDTLETNQLYKDRYEAQGIKVKMYTVHGCKDPIVARDILMKLKMKHGVA